MYLTAEKVQYDYKNQAWLVNGLYTSCEHPEEMQCDCYGKLHAGEAAADNAELN